MSQKEDTGFKITDRRKFNADGSPRKSEPAAVPVQAEVEAANSTASESGAGKVVSFPTDTDKKQPESKTSTQAASGADARSAPASPEKPRVESDHEKAYKQARAPMAAGLPEASFMSLVNMLGVEAALLLGLIQTPGEEAPKIDLESARHLIDTLGMLEAKTRGNLTPEEANLLENILADLRMQFVTISRRG